MGGNLGRQEPSRFLIQGLDAAGKTSLLYRLKLGEVVTTIPTIGFNVETIKTAGGTELTGWDLGGRDKMRPLFRHYYANTAGLIYVIDSADRERLEDTFDELNRQVLSCEELQNIVVMVLANKQDLKDALSPAEIEVQLRKQCRIGYGITVFVMPTSVIDVGVFDAFEKFARIVKDKKNGKLYPGLISHAWEEDQKEKERGGKDKNTKNSLAHEIKMTWMKNPLQMFKSVLFY